MRTFVTIMKWFGVVLGIGVIVVAYLQSMKDDPTPDIRITIEETSLRQADYREERK